MVIKPFCSVHTAQAAAKMAESWLQTCCLVQAAQLRKSSFVQPPDVPESQPAAYAYDADKQSYCTVYAGTFVNQVLCSVHTYKGKTAAFCQISWLLSPDAPPIGCLVLEPTKVPPSPPPPRLPPSLSVQPQPNTTRLHLGDLTGCIVEAGVEQSRCRRRSVGPCCANWAQLFSGLHAAPSHEPLQKPLWGG